MKACSICFFLLLALSVSCGDDDDPVTPKADTTAPAAITDLTCTSSTLCAVELTWTAPGDDNFSGTAAAYDIRYSTSLITEGNEDSATEYILPPQPRAAGTTEIFSVSTLNSGTKYYFGIKTMDEAANESGLSNIDSMATK